MAGSFRNFTVSIPEWSSPRLALAQDGNRFLFANDDNTFVWLDITRLGTIGGVYFDMNELLWANEFFGSRPARDEQHEHTP